MAIIIIIIIITIIIIMVITRMCLVPSKVDKLLASSWCDGERAHVQTGGDDQSSKSMFHICFLSRKDDITKNDSNDNDSDSGKSEVEN